MTCNSKLNLNMDNRDKFLSTLSLVDKFATKEQKEISINLSLISTLAGILSLPEYKGPYQLNVFDYFGGVVETGASFFLKEILKYYKDGNALVVKSFVRTFLGSDKSNNTQKFDIALIKSPKVECETSKIDILIYEEGKYSIIIENKLKGADFQRNQLAKYIARQRIKGFKDEQIFVIILPDNEETYESHIKKSTWRLPPDWYMPNGERKCHINATECLCDLEGYKPIAECDKCERLKAKYSSRTVVLYKELTDWLEDEVSKIIDPQEEPLLSSVVTQFSDYLKGIYKNRINNKLNIAMEKFLREQVIAPNSTLVEQLKTVIEKIDDLSSLQQGLTKLRDSLANGVIEKWLVTLRGKWGETVKSGERNFKVFIGDMQCGCWIQSNGKLYWGFYTGDNPSEEQRTMVYNIIENVQSKGIDIGDYSPYQAKSFVEWNYTDNGDVVCDAFYKAAKELGYLK